jgi:hypothetical protein
MTVPPAMATSRRFARPSWIRSQWKCNLILFGTTVQPQSPQCLRRRTARTRTLFGSDLVNMCGARPALPPLDAGASCISWT